MDIKVIKENIGFFQCFSSEKKIKIMELLGEKSRNIGEMAALLGVSSTIVTRHIGEMEKAGIIETILEPGKRGQQKICSLAHSEVRLHFATKKPEAVKQQQMTIPVGQFSQCQIEPTCGLASTEKYIGMVDDPRYFRDPEASKAGILWFESGHVEYRFPSYLFDHSDSIIALIVSFEICSEYPRYKNDHPSDIRFSLNGTDLGIWTSPGSFGGKKGLYTPAWFTCGTEYGLLKRLMINREATYIDGNLISSVTLDDLNINNSTDQVLRIASPKDVDHPGGVTLFGKGFGNHDQDLTVTILRK